MVAIPINTDTGSIAYEVPDALVFVSNSLAGPWSLVGNDPLGRGYLRLERLRIVASPEIDIAQLSYRFGPIIREDDGQVTQYDPEDLVGKFCRVNIRPTVVGDTEIEWFGIIEVDERDVLGSGVGQLQPMGTQSLVAYGLARLLERKVITESIIVSAPVPFTIQRAIAFNSVEAGSSYRKGNANSINSLSAFDETERAGDEWTGKEAVFYTLLQDASFNVGGVLWEDVAPRGLLDWVDFTVKRQDRTIKAVLDELINRRRGIGYHVKYNAVSDRIEVHVFSFAETPVVLSDDFTLPANPNLRTLNFEQALDVDPAIVRNNNSLNYDLIRVTGAWRTATGTFHFDEDLVKDWTDDEEVAFFRAYKGILNDRNGDDVEYDALDKDEQNKRNKMVRQSDALRHVFARFRIPAGWTQTLRDFLLPTIYWVAPPFDVNGFPIQPAVGDPGLVLWNEGLRFEKRLALRERLDYGGFNIENKQFEDVTLEGLEDFRDPLVISEDETVDPPQFENVSAQSGNHKKRPRGWNATVRVLSHGPLIEVRAKPMQMLAPVEWADAANDIAETEDEEDPGKSETGIDWKTLRATLTLRLDGRVTEEFRIRPQPASGDNVLEIQAGDQYRLDYVVPKTIVELKGGEATASEGGFVRDDRIKLLIIARAAGEWYGKTRQSLDLTYKQVRNIFEIGWLITDFGDNHTLQQVNTVITAIEYRFPTGDEPPTTTIQTSYAQLDF